jgi:hypothetical protein
MRIAVFTAFLFASSSLRVAAAPSAAPSEAADATTTAAPASVGADALRVEVSVDLDPAYDDDLAEAIRAAATDAARGTGREVAATEPATGSSVPAGPSGAAPSTDRPPRLGITVRWSEDAAGDMRVEYTLDDGRAGDGSGPRRFVRGCETCDAAMLVEKMRGEIPRVLAVLDASASSATSADADAAVPAPRPARPVRRPLSRVGWAGVGLSAATAAPLVAGIVLVARGDVLVGPAENPEYLEYQDFRPAGYALLGIAAGVLVTGVALIIVDRVRARRATQRERTTTVAHVRAR